MIILNQNWACSKILLQSVSLHGTSVYTVCKTKISQSDLVKVEIQLQLLQVKNRTKVTRKIRKKRINELNGSCILKIF